MWMEIRETKRIKRMKETAVERYGHVFHHASERLRVSSSTKIPSW
jgi:hypothetical protein